MLEHKKYTFALPGKKGAEVISMIPVRHRKKDKTKKLLKKELMEVF